MLALGGSIQMCISGAIFAEYEEVLRRPKFARDAETIAATLSTIRARSLWVKPEQVIDACSDANDNRFLECAEAAQADFIITGNARHFPVSWANTRIVLARDFLDFMTSPDSLH